MRFRRHIYLFRRHCSPRQAIQGGGREGSRVGEERAAGKEGGKDTVIKRHKKGVKIHGLMEANVKGRKVKEKW